MRTCKLYFHPSTGQWGISRIWRISESKKASFHPTPHCIASTRHTSPYLTSSYFALPNLSHTTSTASHPTPSHSTSPYLELRPSVEMLYLHLRVCVREWKREWERWRVGERYIYYYILRESWWQSECDGKWRHATGTCKAGENTDNVSHHIIIISYKEGYINKQKSKHWWTIKKDISSCDNFEHIRQLPWKHPTNSDAIFPVSPKKWAKPHPKNYSWCPMWPNWIPKENATLNRLR